MPSTKSWIPDGAWGRLALIQAVGESPDVLAQVAKQLGYAPIPSQGMPAHGEYISDPDSAQPASMDDSTGGTPRSPAPSVVFACVRSRQRLRQQMEPPLELAGETLRVTDTPGSYRFSGPTALMPIARLLPLLQNTLGCARSTRRIHTQQLCRRSAKGKPLNNIPRVCQQQWPQQLLIIVDPCQELEPHWGDFARIISGLKALLGETAVSSIRFLENTLDRTTKLYQPWPLSKGGEKPRKWTPPPAKEPILILSDLGEVSAYQSAGGSRAKRAWLRFCEQLTAHPGAVLNLNPVIASPRNPSLCKRVKPTPLNDTVSIPRYPKNSGYRLSGTQSQQLEYFLAVLSYLPVFDPGLLRKLRKDLVLGGSELETLVWNHEHVESVGIGRRIELGRVLRYQEQYQQQIAGSELAQPLWNRVLEHYHNTFCGLRRLVQLLHYEAEPPQTAEAISHQHQVLQYFQQLAATVAQHPSSDTPLALRVQCRTLYHALPLSFQEGKHQAIFDQLAAMAYRHHLAAGQWPEPLPARLQSRLRWAMTADASIQSWSLLQTNALCGCTLVNAKSRATSEPSSTNRIASLTALAGTPIEVQQFAMADDGGERLVSSQRLDDGDSFTLVPHHQYSVITRDEHLVLEGITRPFWAMRMGRDEEGLFAVMPWCGKEIRVFWQMFDKDSSWSETWGWNWPKPFGEDAYGLYVDLELNSVIQRFRWIEPTSFLMGSPEDEKGRNDDEIQHQVILTQGYWLANTACAQILWQSVMGENPSTYKSEANPVGMVSWDDVQNFLKRINDKHTELNLRLPTEAEWENACRAGTTGAFSFDGELSLEKVNYFGSWVSIESTTDAPSKTAKVKSYAPNGWGLYEMHGNVWEWCQDRYAEYSSASVVDPQGAEAGADRVLRGGSWILRGGNCRSACRDHLAPGHRLDRLGFRLARGHELSPVRQLRAVQQPDGTRAAEQRGAQPGDGRRSSEVAEKSDGAMSKQPKNVFKHIKNLFKK